MTDNSTLEMDLRACLDRQASRLPAPVAEAVANPRVVVTARRPSTNLARYWSGGRVWRLGKARAVAVAVAVVTGAGIYLGVGLVDTATPAFASWTSSPEPVPAGAVGGIEAACQQPQAPAILDARGNSVYAVFDTSGGGQVDCLTTLPGHSPDRGLPSGGWITHGSLSTAARTTPSPAEPVVLLSVKAPEGNAVHNGRFTWVSGRVSSNITRVTVQTSGGLVQATVRDGMFAAWWPGNDSDTARIVGYDTTAQAVSTVSELTCGIATINPRVTTIGYPPQGGCRN
jgi:hypothetical protein